MYSDPRVIDIVTRHFTPFRAHVRDQADDFKRLASRYSAQWTPTVLVIDADGDARHRIEGFLPADDFLAQLMLGLAHSAFARGDFGAAEPLFRQVREQYPDTDAAPEAQYWEGVARYKATGDPAALAGTARRFQERYADSSWAKKASVWKS